MINGLTHHDYHLDESNFIFRVIRSDFEFLFYFLKKLLLANRIALDEMLGHLGLYCLLMSYK